MSTALKQAAQSLRLAIEQMDWLPTGAARALWERQQAALPVLRDALAALEESSQGLQVKKQKQELFCVFGVEETPIALADYAGRTELEVASKVLDTARREGYKGTAAARMKQLKWEIRPLYAAPQQEPDKLDAERLDFIENEALELTTRETGEDDFVWEVAQFYMAMPHRRVLGTAGGLRAAIDEARKAQP